MIFVCPHSSRERERDKKRSVTFFLRLKSSSSSLCFFFVIFFSSSLRKKRKKKKEKNRWFDKKRPVGVASRGASTFSAKKSNRRDLFLVFFGPFEKAFLTFRRRGPLWKKTLRTHEERDDDDDCIMGAPASETPCTLRGATTGWSSSFDWSRHRPCSISIVGGECKFLFLLCARRFENWRKLDNGP